MLTFILIPTILALNMPSFYHQSMDLTIDLEELPRNCDRLSYESIRESPKIGLLSFNKNQNKPNKAFIIFGEHARELISPETGIHFVKKLCSDDESVKSIIDNYEMKMIVNMNPISRSKVEQGDFCLRENENGIDLNRNYKAHWSAEYDPQTKHTYPGKFPFSEQETQIVRDQMREFKPDAFFSIHSGTLGLFTPHAYDKEQPAENIENMNSILNEVKEKHCEICKLGSCGHEIGYLSLGTSMDYAYDEQKIPYSFTFEIFHENLDLRDQKKKKSQSFLQKQSNREELMEEQRIDKMLRDNSCFAQTREMPAEECFKYFNPETEDQYNYYIENWSQAIMLALNRINDQRQSQSQPQQQ